MAMILSQYHERRANMYCKNCGDFIKDNENFCQTCERPINRIIPFKERSGKKRKGLAFLIVMIITFFVAFAIIFNVTDIFGAVDLGIKSSEKAYKSAMHKFETSLKKLNGYTDIVLTNEEITSLIKYNWPQNEVARNLQVRVNGDGTVEAAGQVNKNYLLKYIFGEQINEDSKSFLKMIEFMPEYPEIYGKFNFEIKNNAINYISISKLQVMGLDIPEKMYDNVNTKNQMADGINQFINIISDKTGASFDLVQTGSKKLVVRGLLPKIVKRQTLASAFEEFSYKR